MMASNAMRVNPTGTLPAAAVAALARPVWQVLQVLRHHPDVGPEAEDAVHRKEREQRWTFALSPRPGVEPA